MSPTAVLTTHIELDAEGVAWITGTRVMVTEVVLDKMAYGWSPEEMQVRVPIGLMIRGTRAYCKGDDNRGIAGQAP